MIKKFSLFLSCLDTCSQLVQYINKSSIPDHLSQKSIIPKGIKNSTTNIVKCPSIMNNVYITISTALLLAILIVQIVQMNYYTIIPIFAQPNSTTMQLEEPATLVIATNPKTPDIQIVIDGIPYKSDSNGNIIFRNYTGKYRIEIPTILTVEKTKNDASVAEFSRPSSSSSSSSHFTFGRWRPFNPENFTITLTSGIDAYFQLGIVRVSEVKLEFLDANSNKINKSNIDEVVLISNKGQIMHLTYPFEALLENNYFNNERRSNVKEEGGLTIITLPELQNSPLSFRVSEALIDGVNVVDKSKNTGFYPRNTSAVNVFSKVYPLNVKLIDRIFGSPLDGSITIENIDIKKGSNTIASKELTHRYKVVDGELSISQLPKGIYVLKTDGGLGLGGSAAVVLSKPQDVTINLVSYQSVVILAIILIVILLIAVVTIRRIFSLSPLQSRGNKNSRIRRKKLRL